MEWTFFCISLSAALIYEFTISNNIGKTDVIIRWNSQSKWRVRWMRIYINFALNRKGFLFAQDHQANESLFATKESTLLRLPFSRSERINTATKVIETKKHKRWVTEWKSVRKQAVLQTWSVSLSSRPATAIKSWKLNWKYTQNE